MSNSAHIPRQKMQHAVGHLSTHDQDAEAVEFRQGLASAAAFGHQHGHTRIPDGFLTEQGFPLATWVASQRLAHLEDRLPPPHCEALEQITGWDWHPQPRSPFG